MAIEFYDGYDHYSTSELSHRYNSILSSVIGAYGRYSTNGLRLGGAAGASGNVRRVVSNTATKVLGFAVYLNGPLNVPQSVFYIQFDYTGTGRGGLMMNSDGTFTYYRSINESGQAVLGTTSKGLLSGRWYFVQMKVLFSETVGTVEVKINGESVLNLTGVNTGAYTVNNIYLHTATTPGYSAKDPRIDDLYVDTADFRGDRRVELLMPTANGYYEQWTPTGGTINFECVDDNPPNQDTDYNGATVLTYKDSFEFSDMETTAGAVPVVVVECYARKDDAGERYIRPFARIGTVDYNGGTMYLGDDYQFLFYFWEQNPATSAAWEISEVNSTEFGYELIE